MEVVLNKLLSSSSEEIEKIINDESNIKYLTNICIKRFDKLYSLNDDLVTNILIKILDQHYSIDYKILKNVIKYRKNIITKIIKRNISECCGYYINEDKEMCDNIIRQYLYYSKYVYFDEILDGYINLDVFNLEIAYLIIKDCDVYKGVSKIINHFNTKICDLYDLEFDKLYIFISYGLKYKKHIVNTNHLEYIDCKKLCINNLIDSTIKYTLPNEICNIIHEYTNI